jgi:hypothetical protein
VENFCRPGRLPASKFSINKKYVIRVSDEECAVRQDVIKKRQRSPQKIRRAQILLKTDADGLAWIDAKNAEAFSYCLAF